MKAPLILVLAALCSPAAAALSQARPDVNFDGSRARAEAPLVPASASMDGRTAEQIARDEQVKADERAAAARVPGADTEPEPPKPGEALEPASMSEAAPSSPVSDGALPGLAGLFVGVLFGGSIGYAMSRFPS